MSLRVGRNPLSAHPPPPSPSLPAARRGSGGIRRRVSPPGCRGRPDGEAAQSVALLMARHWQPAHDYAVICLASSATLAAMVTAAAFHQVLDRLALGEPAVALRPRLLVAVRDTVREWSAEDRISGVLPELGKPAGGRGMRAAKSMTPENRKLAERSFQALPGTRPLSALAYRGRGRAVKRARRTAGHGYRHRRRPPSNRRVKNSAKVVYMPIGNSRRRKDCRFYNRLLDVPIRRGGALLPDVQQHLAQCRYCRYAAEQLSHFEGGLGVLLAEAVLGWGARRYLDTTTRAGRSPPDPAHAAPPGTAAGRTSPPVADPRADPPVARRTALLPDTAHRSGRGLGRADRDVLAAGLWSDDDGVDPAASATGGGTASQSPPAVSTSPPGTAQLPNAPRQTRLRNAEADLCLDIRGEPKAGAGTELADVLGRRHPAVGVREATGCCAAWRTPTCAWTRMWTPAW